MSPNVSLCRYRSLASLDPAHKITHLRLDLPTFTFNRGKGRFGWPLTLRVRVLTLSARHGCRIRPRVSCLCHLLSLHKLDETIQPNAADLQVLLYGVLCSVFVLLQRSLTLFSPKYLKLSSFMTKSSMWKQAQRVNKRNNSTLAFTHSRCFRWSQRS